MLQSEAHQALIDCLKTVVGVDRQGLEPHEEGRQIPVIKGFSNHVRPSDAQEEHRGSKVSGLYVAVWPNDVPEKTSYQGRVWKSCGCKNPCHYDNAIETVYKQNYTMEVYRCGSGDLLQRIAQRLEFGKCKLFGLSTCPEVFNEIYVTPLVQGEYEERWRAQVQIKYCHMTICETCLGKICIEFDGPKKVSKEEPNVITV